MDIKYTVSLIVIFIASFFANPYICKNLLKLKKFSKKRCNVVSFFTIIPWLTVYFQAEKPEEELATIAVIMYLMLAFALPIANA